MGTAASTGGGGSTGPSGSTAGGGGGGGGSTVTGSTGGSTGPAFVGWGDDWRTRMAAGSTDVEREVKQLERYESPEQVWRKARELERRLSSGELRSTLKKDATAQEVAQYRKEMGIPETPEGYKINMPAGRQAPKEDDAFLKAFLKNAHSAHYTQGQVDSALTAFYSEVDRAAGEMEAHEKKLEETTEDALRKEWGQDYRTNKAMAEALLSRAPAGFRDRFMNGHLADGTPIKADPASWKWLVQMEREINPAATVVPGATGDLGKTIADELADLKKLMGNPNSAYWKGPEAEKKQARYRELVAAQEKLQAKAKAA